MCVYVCVCIYPFVITLCMKAYVRVGVCMLVCVCLSCAWSKAGSQTPAVMLTFRSAWLMRDQQGMPPSKSGNGSPVRKPSDPIPPPASHTCTYTHTHSEAV